jgi:hypothetical protein
MCHSSIDLDLRKSLHGTKKNYNSTLNVPNLLLGYNNIIQSNQLGCSYTWEFFLIGMEKEAKLQESMWVASDRCKFYGNHSLVFYLECTRCASNPCSSLPTILFPLYPDTNFNLQQLTFMRFAIDSCHVMFMYCTMSFT